MAYLDYDDDGTITLHDNWYEFDIRDAAWEEFGASMDRDQVEAVMKLLVDSFDASIGINWGVIHAAIDQVINQPTKE